MGLCLLPGSGSAQGTMFVESQLRTSIQFYIFRFLQSVEHRSGDSCTQSSAGVGPFLLPKHCWGRIVNK